MKKISFIIICVLLAAGCGTQEQQNPTELPRDALGYSLLDPMPENAVEMPNGTYRLVIEREDGGQIYGYEERIFNITFTRSHSGGEEISSIIEKALRRFGEPVYSDSIVYRFEDEHTLTTMRIGRSNYTISLSDKALTERALGESPNTEQSLLQIPRGKPITVDGTMRGNEWDDALPLGIIRIAADWTVSVFAKHDGENLLLVFLNAQIEDEKYICPEVLIDADGNRAPEWDSDDFWFHASVNDCDAVGSYNKWEDCAPEKTGWQASNFPLVPPGHMEFSISFEKLGISEPSRAPIGLAVNVTDTKERWLFWPDNATLESPTTWAVVYLE